MKATRIRNWTIAELNIAAHELSEQVTPLIKLAQKALLASPYDLAVNSAHGVAFHHGLGTPLHPTSSTPMSKYLNAESLSNFASVAYSKPNFAVIANGVEQGEFSKWVNEFFPSVSGAAPSNVPQLDTAPTKYYGGEERIAHGTANAMVIAFPGSSSFTAGSSFKPEMSVLASLLGGQSNIKWSPGFSLLAKAAAEHQHAHVSTTHAAYSDAGLLYTTITGNAEHIRAASKSVVDTLKKVAAGEVASEDIKKAVATAKFRALESGQQTQAGIESTGSGLIQGGRPYQIDDFAKSLESVSEEKVKAVRILLFSNFGSANEPCHRLPNNFSKARPPYRPLVISLFYRTLQRLVSMYKLVCVGWGAVVRCVNYSLLDASEIDS